MKEIALNLVDATTVEMKTDGWTEALTAQEVTQLINALATIREKMTPGFSKEAPTGLLHGVRVDPKWAVGLDDLQGGVILRLLHSSFGWLIFQIPEHEVRGMISGFQKTLAIEKPSRLSN